MIFPTAVAFRVLDAGGDAGDIGLVLAGRFAALVLFASSAGSGADRRPGRWSGALLPLGLALDGPAVEAVGRGPVLGLTAATCVLPSLLVLLVRGVPEFRSPEPAGGSGTGSSEVPVGA